MAESKASRDRWVRQIAALDDASAPKRAQKSPLTVDRIVETALEIVEADGFQALTMRRVAAELGTGPASLYAHVRGKADLDDLLIGRLCARVNLPTPDPRLWKEQFLGVCGQLRDLYLAYPGISRAALASGPTSLDTMAVSECLLAILLSGGVEPQSAAWAIDAAFLYVSAYSLETTLRHRADDDGRVLDREDIIERFEMLPSSRFPQTVAHARELTSGEGHERFLFTLDLLVCGLTPSSGDAPRR